MAMVRVNIFILGLLPIPLNLEINLYSETKYVFTAVLSLSTRINIVFSDISHNNIPICKHEFIDLAIENILLIFTFQIQPVSLLFI